MDGLALTYRLGFNDEQATAAKQPPMRRQRTLCKEATYQPYHFSLWWFEIHEWKSNIVNIAISDDSIDYSLNQYSSQLHVFNYPYPIINWEGRHLERGPGPGLRSGPHMRDSLWTLVAKRSLLGERFFRALVEADCNCHNAVVHISELRQK